jgi:hypothetical protein
MIIDVSVNPYNGELTFVSGAVVLLGSKLTAVSDDLVAAGNTIDTAAPLPGQTNIIRSGVTGGGFNLPMIVQGTIIVINEWTEDALVYPPKNTAARLNELAIGQGVIVSPHGKVEFSTAFATIKWVAR